MNLYKLSLFTLGIISLFLNCVSIDPFTILGLSAAFGGSAVVYQTFDKIKENTYCKFRECCNEDYIKNDVNKLLTTLQRKVFGQHVVIDTVVPAIQAHLDFPKKKALALSFHGWPGSGKNYVSQFIIESLYKEGMNSKFVHMYNGGHHFPEEEHVTKYKVKLASEIKAAVGKCQQSLFVFDEVDKMPRGILDALTAMLDYNNNIDGIDYRKAIFIFLSNKGGKEISQHLLNIWAGGLRREDTKLYHFERLISNGAFHQKGGFENSDTIKSSLIDHYIPFFPLERRHVELCTRYEFQKMGVVSPSTEDVDEVLSYMTYGPDKEKLFSNSGCKRVTQKVATIVTRNRMRLDDEI